MRFFPFFHFQFEKFLVFGSFEKEQRKKSKFVVKAFAVCIYYIKVLFFFFNQSIKVIGAIRKISYITVYATAVM